jgi:hypothetical protein
MSTEDWTKILSDWKIRISGFQDAQYEQASLLTKRHYQLGIPAIAFAAVAGTTVFANLGKDFSLGARLLVAFVSITTALLAAMQTFLNYGQRAEAHRSISHQFGNLRREIDILEQFPPSTEMGMKNALLEFNRRIEQITKDAPLIDVPPTGLPIPSW